MTYSSVLVTKIRMAVINIKLHLQDRLKKDEQGRAEFYLFINRKPDCWYSAPIEICTQHKISIFQEEQYFCSQLSVGLGFS